ncbi:MAG: transposase [Clostridia bacterium]|nr:transposase [Clostridia bacterium]
MERVKPTRKSIRLTEYDYRTPGAYFITICTKDRRCVLWENVGTGNARPPKLSQYGNIVDEAVGNISAHYAGIAVDKYVIMPNHIHLLLRICCDENGRAMPVPTVSTVIQQTKGYVTKRIGHSIWQTRFYDHIIRNQADYDDAYRYIEENPLRWEADELYP